MRKDLHNSINPKNIMPPVAATTDNTARVSSIIDTAGYESCEVVFLPGTETDADAAFTVTAEHGDDAALADTSVPAATDLIGTTALASFLFSDDNKAFKIGYLGTKRYVRFTVTPTNNTGNFFLAAVALLGHAKTQPTANPPT